MVSNKACLNGMVTDSVSYKGHQVVVSFLKEIDCQGYCTDCMHMSPWATDYFLVFKHPSNVLMPIAIGRDCYTC